MVQTPQHQGARSAALEGRIQVLRSLCREIDPYAPLNPEVRERLRELGIDAEEKDPFALTNHLLSLMEDALEEFHQLGKGSSQGQ